ncbi:hypothetical protein [Flavobacterium branchiophilum]|uniref:Uncharacterized protein n=1 Tax=Flavobacterium branchiophilum TaxID=55197 RepID=A0A2H3KML8_9FLAO|nr:hypothetical protein [Flavobacterium branchiophilum]PDS24706.1 hypothetical protein B0A77_07155 [Flavobacterium branchiophilum]
MKKKEIIRSYHFPDAVLVTTSNAKIAFMERDAVQFTDYGITPDMVADLKASVIAFSDFSTDIESLNDQTDATASKDAKAAELKQELTSLMSRVAAKYTVKSAKYRKFGAGNISQKTDADLLLTAKRVIRVATPMLSELATNGVTAQMLTTITTHANSFENLLIDKEIKVGDRDIQQEDRVEAGNLVYADLIKYCGIGQAIWAATDVAKYNDYVVYNTQNGQAPTVATPIEPEQ